MYTLTAKRYQIERLKEEAWTVLGGPQRVLSDRDLADLLGISTSALGRVKAGGRVPSQMVAGVVAVFKKARPDLVDDLWHVAEHEEAAA